MKRLLFVILVASIPALLMQCGKEYSYEKAAGSLKDSLNLCRPVVLSGHYQAGASLASPGYFVIVMVNVTKTGQYNISTNQVNGFSFSASGSFGTLGLHEVKLKPQGSPLRDTVSLFTCSFDTSTCAFVIDVKKELPGTTTTGPDTLELNSWRFWDNNDLTYHHGPIDLSGTWLLKSTFDNTNYLNILGWAGNRTNFNKDSLFLIELFLPELKIDTGIISITAGVGNSNFFGYANNTILPQSPQFSYFHFYNSLSGKNPDFIFRITSYEADTKKVKGEFYGTSQRRIDYSDNPGTVHTIRGEFYFQLP